MANQNNTVESIETQAAALDNTSAETVTEAHTHIDFGSLDFNDPESVASIDLSKIECAACLEAYAEHFGESEADNSNDLLAGISFEPGNFVKNLSYMGTGMLGIFIVIALIMCVTTVLNKLFSGKKKADESAEN